MAPTAISKKMRTRLTLAQRADAIRQLQSGAPLRYVMNQFAISRRSALTIKKDSNKIIDLAISTEDTLKIKTFQQSHFTMIDAEVYQFESKAQSLKFLSLGLPSPSG